MKTKFTQKFLTLMILGACSTACFATEDHGADRIKDAWKYNFWLRQPGSYTLSGFGYELQPGSHRYGYKNFTMDSWETASERGPVESWKDNHGVTRSSFSDDIKGAILDKDEFEVALSENRFSDAWCMGGETRQGSLWKRLAIAQSKKHLKQLVRESIFEGNIAKLVEARSISATFPEETRAELDIFIGIEEAAARETLANLAPDVSARTTALRTLADRLFE